MRSLPNTDLIRKALLICYQVHKEQFDKAGFPYVFHPYTVALQMDSELEICTALLHDVIEDSYITLEDIEQAGFPKEIIEALRLLTRNENEDYLQYIETISHNDLARAVKIADLEHNSDLSRISNPTVSDIKRVQKYQKAQRILKSASFGSIENLISLLSAAIKQEQPWLNIARIARLASSYFGKRFVAGDASSYIFYYAQTEGFEIPPYPLSSSGELKKFLAEEHVKNLSSWYVKKEITNEEYTTLYDKTIVEIRRMDGKRKVFLYPNVLYKENVVFKPLTESGFIDKVQPQVLYKLLYEALNWIKEDK